MRQARAPIILIAIVLLTLPLVAGAQDRSSSSPEEERLQKTIDTLTREARWLLEENQQLRQELADARQRAVAASRELAELRQFLLDHETLGRDFQEYRGIKEIAERAARQKKARENRRLLEERRAARRARGAAAKAAYEQRRAERERVAYYRNAGFSPVGLDVYTSRMSFFYRSVDATRSRIDYEPFLGHYLRLYPNTEVDFSSMTISGSVLNASGQVRDIGIAIAFFDESGNQVGHEIVRVSNARPDVPYPFTSTLEMALNRPFASSSTYVLYADPVEGAAPEDS